MSATKNQQQKRRPAEIQSGASLKEEPTKMMMPSSPSPTSTAAVRFQAGEGVDSATAESLLLLDSRPELDAGGGAPAIRTPNMVRGRRCAASSFGRRVRQKTLVPGGGVFEQAHAKRRLFQTHGETMPDQVVQPLVKEHKERPVDGRGGGCHPSRAIAARKQVGSDRTNASWSHGQPDKKPLALYAKAELAKSRAMLAKELRRDQKRPQKNIVAGSREVGENSPRPFSLQNRSVGAAD